jgi:uncharacterized protein YybS (DUF2232 family)
MLKNENNGEGPNKRLLPSFVRFSEWLHLSCLSAFLFVSGIYIPIIGAVLSLLSAVPISLIGVRHGVYKAFTAVMFVAVSMFLPFGYMGSLSFILNIGFLGIVFCYFVRKTNSAGEAIFGLVIAALISKLIFMGLIVYISGHSPYILDESSIDAIEKYYKTYSVRDDILEMVKQFINMLIPSILIVYAGMEAFVNYLLVSVLESRRQRTSSVPKTETNELKIHPLPPFEQWSFPRSLLSAFLIAFLIPLLDTSDSSIILLSAEYNLKALTAVMFYIQGFCFVWWWAKNYSYGVRLSIFFVLLFVPVFSIGVIIIGTLDIALNLRERIRRNSK